MELFRTGGGSLFASVGNPLRGSAGGNREEGIGGNRAWPGMAAPRTSLLPMAVPRDVEPIPPLFSPPCGKQVTQLNTKNMMLALQGWKFYVHISSCNFLHLKNHRKFIQNLH